MEKSLAYRWIVALFFSVVGIMFIGSIAYLAVGNVAPDTYWGRSMSLPKTSSAVPDDGLRVYTLELNQGVSIGNRTLFFRGRQGDQLHLDVILSEIDPQYAYPFRIGIRDARQGTAVAGLHFRLEALHTRHIRIALIPSNPPPAD